MVKLKIFGKILLLTCVATCYSNLAYANENHDSDKVEVPKANIEAEGIFYDEKSKNLVAEGNVEITYEGRYIKAKQLEYNKLTKQITASDGVEFKTQNGSIFKADSIITDDKVATGELTNVEAKMQDGSSFKSEKISIIGDEKYSLKNSVYSPCKPCGDKYLWDVNAENIYYDSDSERVYYRNATIEVLGVPLFYTPYISHPTPLAKSKTGFLTPVIGRSSEYGTFFETPYYYNPKPNLDFTFTPKFTSRDSIILTNEFRQLLEYGRYEVTFSGAYPKERDSNGNILTGAGKKFRGHIDGFGDFDLEDNWQVGFDAKRSTDDTYLQRYDYDYEDVLTSMGYVRKIDGRDYISSKVLSFQGLRNTDDPSVSPYILPLINFSKTFTLDGNYNQKLSVSGNVLSLRRDTGTKSNRFSSTVGWSANYITSGGHILDLSLSSRFDYYRVDEVPTSKGLYSGNTGRVIPEAVLTWRYPLTGDFNKYSIVFEPVVMAIASNNGNNNEKISNEDSQNIEIYDYNLFQSNHISGFDLVENGSRVNYGIRSVVATESLGEISVLLGQNYRFEEDRFLTAQSGMDKRFSDYVGRVTASNSEHFSTNYRFRVDKDNLKFQRNELGFDVNYNPVDLTFNYTFIDGLLGAVDRQEIYADTRVALDSDWALIGKARRNMDNDNNTGWVNLGGGVEYTNDCMKTVLEVKREFTRDRDIEPSTEILLKVSLQNLGS